MVHSLRPLAETPEARGICLAFVCAQILENTLKAYITKTEGNERNVLRPGLRHNLTALWDHARELGLPLSAIVSEWVTTLSRLHNHPYYLRYSTNDRVV